MQEQAEYEKFFRQNEQLTLLQKLAGKISGLTNPLTFVIINFAILVLIHTGAVRVSLGTLSQGQVVALYNYMSQILVELIKLANLIISVTRAMACFNRIQDVFSIEPSMKEGNEKSTNIRNDVPAVEFKNVSFTYAGGGDHAIENISFKAMAGQTIGIIGGTGSGKSTLVNLIPRFYDATEGEIDIAGENVREYTYESLRKMISVVPQKAQLFAGTIRDNLMFGCPDATEEQIEEALVISQAKTFADEGIEIIQFETFMSLDVLADVIPKIKKELGLFIMVSFSVNQLGYSASGLSAKNLINDICAVDGVDAVGLNCGIGPYHMYNILEKIKLPEDKVLIAIPNAGYPVLTRNRMEFNSHPEYFAEKTKELLSLGADIIGGCCGTSPEFIKSLYDIMSMDIKADKKIQKTDAADEKVSKRCGFLYDENGRKKDASY